MWHRIQAGIAGLIFLLIVTAIAAAGDPAPEAPPAGNRAERLKQRDCAVGGGPAAPRPRQVAGSDRRDRAEAGHRARNLWKNRSGENRRFAGVLGRFAGITGGLRRRPEGPRRGPRDTQPAARPRRLADHGCARGLAAYAGLAKASPQQRKELAEADRLLTQASNLVSLGKSREAIRLAELCVSSGSDS